MSDENGRTVAGRDYHRHSSCCSFVRRGIRLMRLAGIDVYLDWSFLIVFVLITMSLGAEWFPSWHPQWTPTVS